jgi:phage shock protein E
MLNFLKKLFGASEKPDLNALIEEGAFLVDVRSPQEFAQSKVKGSVNIPLDSISRQISKFKDKKHIIVFCRSGNRSSQAKSILQRNGFTNVVNGGTAGNVNQFVK